jgi:hypothetical protein
MTKINSLKIRFEESEQNDIRAEILIDNKPVIDSEYVLDLDELEKSIDYHGKFFILTCESNKPNLIHLSKGIDINKNESENIQWKLSEDFNDNNTYIFDNDEYRKSILDAVSDWKKIVIDKEEKNKLSYQDIHSYVKYSEQDDEE